MGFGSWLHKKSEDRMLQITFSGFGRLARWGPMCPGLSGLPALFQLYLFWTWKPNEVSSTSTMSIQHAAEGRPWLMKIRMVGRREYFSIAGSPAGSSPPAKRSSPSATTVMLGFPTARWGIVNYSVSKYHTCGWGASLIKDIVLDFNGFPLRFETLSRNKHGSESWAFCR